MDGLLPTEFTVLMNTYVTSSLDASFFAILLIVHFWLVIYLMRVLRHILVWDLANQHLSTHFRMNTLFILKTLLLILGYSYCFFGYLTTNLKLYNQSLGFYLTKLPLVF